MYPSPDDGKYEDKKFTEILKLVGLEYFNDFKKTMNWSTISLGEQQKLAMSRLFFHAPKFA